LNLSYFISRRITKRQQEGFSSMAACIVSFLIMKGFQETVKNKIYSFSSHILVTKFSMNNSQEEQPMDINIELYNNPSSFPSVKHVQEYAHKTALIKTENEVYGFFIKGVSKRFDMKSFEQNMVAGKFVTFPDSGYSNDIVISQVIAEKIKANVGDELLVHFFQNPPRYRRLTVSGIYETNLSEYFDSRIVIGDLRMIQRLNDWPDSVAGGLEVFVKDPELQEEASVEIGEMMDYDLNVQPISERYMQIFEWLHLLSRQVNILLIIILIVVCVNMISIVLILVMERTQMIGMLKAVGASNPLVRSIFVYSGVNLVIKGLLIGNILGLGICFVQYKFKVIKLNPHDYYMDFVPISWNWEIVALLNILIFIIVSLVLLLPTMIISRINPIKAIKFD
jgi:lipoprotein-releasing system permease protein